MKKINKFAKYIFFPKIVFTILFSLLASGLFIWQFVQDSPDIIISYVSYFMVAYGVVLFVVRLPSAIKAAINFKNENKHVRRFFEDSSSRVKIMLYYNIILNLIFASLQLVLGAMNNSKWLIVLGIYYGFLVIVRVVLLFEARKNRLGENLITEHKCCQFCSLLICMMDVSVFFVVYYIVAEGKGFSYNYFITFLFALYAFCILTFTIMNLAKCINCKTPVISTAEWINLVEALMCIIFLETSVVSLLIKDEDYALRKLIVSASGLAVAFFVFFISLFLYIKTTIKIKKLKKSKLGMNWLK